METPRKLLKSWQIVLGRMFLWSSISCQIIVYDITLKNIENKKAFVFTTSGQGKASYNYYLKQLLREKNFEVVGEFTCKGFDTYGLHKIVGGINKGRPNEDDLKKAKLFAEGLNYKFEI